MTTRCEDNHCGTAQLSMSSLADFCIHDYANIETIYTIRSIIAW